MWARLPHMFQASICRRLFDLKLLMYIRDLESHSAMNRMKELVEHVQQFQEHKNKTTLWKFKVTIAKKVDSVCKSIYSHAWQNEFDPQDPNVGKRDRTSNNCSLTSTSQVISIGFQNMTISYSGLVHIVFLCSA